MQNMHVSKSCQVISDYLALFAANLTTKAFHNLLCKVVSQGSMAEALRLPEDVLEAIQRASLPEGAGAGAGEGQAQETARGGEARASTSRAYGRLARMGPGDR